MADYLQFTVLANASVYVALEYGLQVRDLPILDAVGLADGRDESGDQRYSITPLSPALRSDAACLSWWTNG